MRERAEFFRLPYPRNGRLVRRSIIPRARSYKDCRAGLIAGAAGDRIVTVNLTCGRVQRPKESDRAVASRDFKCHRRAHDEAARRKRSRGHCPRTEAGRIESNGSGDRKATCARAGAALSHVARHGECSSPRREGPFQGITDIPYLDAGGVSLLAVGTTTVDHTSR